MEGQKTRRTCPRPQSVAVTAIGCVTLGCPLTCAMAFNALFHDWMTSFQTERGPTASVQSACLGVMFGTGGGFSMVHLTTLSVVLTRFPAHSGVVSSLMSTAGGLFHLTTPLFFRFLSEQYTWRGCLIIVAGVVLQMVILGLLLTSPLLAPSASRRSHLLYIGESKSQSKSQPLLTTDNKNSEAAVDSADGGSSAGGCHGENRAPRSLLPGGEGPQTTSEDGRIGDTRKPLTGIGCGQSSDPQRSQPGEFPGRKSSRHRAESELDTFDEKEPLHDSAITTSVTGSELDVVDSKEPFRDEAITTPMVELGLKVVDSKEPFQEGTTTTRQPVHPSCTRDGVKTKGINEANHNESFSDGDHYRTINSSARDVDGADLHQHFEEANNDDVDGDPELHQTKKPTSQWRFLADPLYLLLVATFVCTLSSQNGMVILVLDLALSKGWTVQDGILFNFSFMLGSLIGRASVGVASLSRRLNGVILLAVGGFVGAAGMGPLGFVNGYYLLAWQMFVMGLSFGCLNGVYPVAVLRVAGTRAYAMALGLTLTVEGLMDASFGVLTGVLVDHLQSYRVPCLVYGLVSLTLSVVLIILSTLRKPHTLGEML